MKKALLVIDYIKGIAETGSCAQYLKDHPSTIKNTNRLIEQARKKAIPVIHIRLAFDESYQGLPTHAPTTSFIKNNKKFLLGTPDTEFIASIDVDSNTDHILNKKYGDPFYGSNLFEKLSGLGAQEVILTGIATDNAILYGTNSAMNHGFFVSVVTDAIGAATLKAHEDAQALMKGRSVNQLLNTETILQTI